MSKFAPFSAEDESSHAVDDAHYSESYYFNFVDAASGLAGLLRVGNRLGEGHAEVTALVILPDGRVAFRYAKPQITEPRFDLAGFQLKFIEPFHRSSVRYEDEVHLLSDGRALERPKHAFANSPVAHLVVDLAFDSTTPPVGWKHQTTKPDIDIEGIFAPNHYEAACQVIGSITVSTTTFSVAGAGVRDHSWGVRNWQGPEWYRWLSAIGKDGDALVAWVMKLDGVERQWGYLVRQGRCQMLTEVSIRTTEADPGGYPNAVSVLAKAGEHEVQLSGRRLGLVPLRHRGASGAPDARLSELVFEFEGSGLTPVRGISEFHDLVPAGTLDG